MNYFIINLTDSAALDQQVAIGLEEPGDLGYVAQVAINDILASRGEEVKYPLSVSIRLVTEFSPLAAFYDGARSEALGLN